MDNATRAKIAHAMEILRSIGTCPDEVRDWVEGCDAREYRAEVLSIAGSIMEDMRDDFMSGDKDVEDFDQRLHEECDGHEWVIYYAKQSKILNNSDVDAANYADEFGEAPKDDTALACWALRQDVGEVLFPEVYELEKKRDEMSIDED